MTSTQPLLISENNISLAWGRVILHILENSGIEISPLIVSVTDSTEIPNIREALEQVLVVKNQQKVNTVANTIFPSSLWRRSQYERSLLFSRYIKILPKIIKAERHKNHRGLYFERLIKFGSGPEQGNQLEYIISQYTSRTGVRKSMFQASIFDPGRDHIASAQLPFPCLQHVSFVPNDGGLVLNAFYATQQMFNKAYGNYLGLYRLGEFMAQEMGLSFERMNCFIGVAKLERIGKTSPEIRLVSEAIKSSLPK